MFALMGELNLWTFDDNVKIRDTDFGAFKYYDKRINGTHGEGKRSYCEKRDMICAPVNKKGNRLKDCIKYLEDQLRDNSIIYCRWYSDRILQLMFSNGLLVHVQIYPLSGDVEKISFDKYLVGKLSEHASDVIITKSHIVCTYNDNEVTVVYLAKPKSQVFENINKLEPKLITKDIFVPNGRKLDKKIQANKSEDLILIWWKSTMNEVYPWSPTMREYHRANMHLFRLAGTKLESLCYIRTEFDPLCIMFDACDDKIIHSVEQKVSRKGEVTVEWRTYEVSQQNKLQRIAMISVPLPTHTSCVKFSPNQELLLLCCIDGTITMYDPTKAITTSARTAFIPTLAAWHSDGMVFVVGNDRGQLQHFNIALQCIKSQTLCDEAMPANILDLSPYFRNQPALIHMEWNKRNDPNYVGFYNNGNSLFLLLFERGPVGVFKVTEGDNLTGDELVRRYLSGYQIKQATYLLLSMNWDTHPRACMHSLNQILNYLFKLPLTTNYDGLIQNALGSFHLPARPISHAVEEEYGNEVRDLTRRYFHRLLRYRMFEKAFRLAIDLNDHDLFMDIHFLAVALNDVELATAARERAESILSRSNSRGSSHSTCSRTSCSLCSDTSGEKNEEEEKEEAEEEEKEKAEQEEEDNEDDDDQEEEKQEEEEEEERKEDETYEEEEETYSEESGDSRKEEWISLKHSAKRYNYRKTPSSQIPPLPVVHPHRNIETALSTSYNDITSSTNSKNEYNSTFDTSKNNILTTTTSFNHSPSISSPFRLASTSLNKPLYKTHSDLTPPTNAANIVDSPAFNNASDDLMTTSFGSLSFSESEVTVDDRSAENFGETPYDRLLFNEIPYSFDDTTCINVTTTCAQSDNFISTPFNKLTHESEDVRSDYPVSSLDAVDNNIMSTSFSTRVSNAPQHGNSFNVSTTNKESETVSSAPRNVKFSYEILSDNNLLSTTLADTTDKSSILYSTCNNLMSTSFNYPEDDVTPVKSNETNAFNDQAIQLQRSAIEKKGIDFGIPSSPLPRTSSRVNYLHGLPKKNYLLTRSTPGLTDIIESIHKFPLYKTACIPSRVLQRQNSVSNILQNQKASLPSYKTYRYNYDLNYLPIHRGIRDDTDLQCSQTGRKFGLSQSFQPSYSVQRRLLESRHLPRSSQSNASSNVNRETMSCNVPPLPIINSSNSKVCLAYPPFGDAPPSSNEKPKVKFSDTVTHILVPPGANQAHRQKRSVAQAHLADPAHENLSSSLSNEDYLRDFSSLPKDNTMDEKVKDPLKSDDSTKIKVVHFGLL